MKLFTFRLPIPEKFWKTTGNGNGKIYRGKYELLIEMPGIALVFGSDFKLLPFKNIELPINKLVILEKAYQVDNFLYATLDVRENPIPLVALGAGLLAAIGLSALGWSVMKITRLVEVTTNSVLVLGVFGGLLYFLGKKLRIIK